MLTTLGPGIFDWEAAGGGQSSRETSVRLHGATSARPTSLKPSRSNPCELEHPWSSPGMLPGRGPSLLRATHHPYAKAHPSRLKSQGSRRQIGEFIFRKWGVDAHQ